MKKWKYYVVDEDRVVLFDENKNEIGFFVIDDLLEKVGAKRKTKWW